MYQVEALCNRIVLINQGRTVLYGEVDKIKRDFAGNAVLVEGQGEFDGIPGLLETRMQNGERHLILESGTSPQDVFRALARRESVIIERFEIAEPSLDDIFIAVVQEDGKGSGSHE
jgi:ABC-2 type transport system ATP-binding protein